MALAIAFALRHVVVFVMTVIWTGAYITRIDPATGTLMACLAQIVVQSGWSGAPRLRG